MAQENSRLGEPLCVPLSKRTAANGSYIVCGWYTADHANWVFALRQSLDVLGVPHDFVETARSPEGEASRMRAKPLHVRDAMDRNPTRTVVFLDAHCRIVGTLDDLRRLADIKGDVGIRMRTERARRRAPLIALDGATLVLKPTTEARFFIERWIEVSAVAPLDWSDQESLSVVAGHIPMISITNIGAEFCTEARDRYPRPVILHDGASLDARTGRLAKLASRVWG